MDQVCHPTSLFKLTTDLNDFRTFELLNVKRKDIELNQKSGAEFGETLFHNVKLEDRKGWTGESAEETLRGAYSFRATQIIF